MKLPSIILLFLIAVFGVFLSADLFGQSIIKGSVTDVANQEKLIGVDVVVLGVNEKVKTNIDGRFLISLNLDEPKTLVISFKGYQRQSITVIDPKDVKIELERIYSQGFRSLKGSSYKENELLNADFVVDHINSLELLEMPNGPGLDGLSNYQSIFSVRPGDRMQIMDFRGFSTSEFSRSMHITDGIDMSIPDFGSPIGILTTPSDIDISALEMRSGPASTLHGNGAYSGVMAYITKDPWQQRGLTVSVRGATGSEIDAQARFAQLLDKKQRFGVKITAQFNRLDGQFGTDRALNEYGALDQTYVFDAASVATELGLDANQSSLVDRYYNWATTIEQDASLIQKPIEHGGYSENSIARSETRLLKLNGALHYKVDDKIHLSYNYRMGLGSGFYQADSRFNLHNFLWQQHSLKAKGNNWRIAAHGTFSQSGNSYNLNGTARRLTQIGSTEFLKDFLLSYADSLESLSSGFSQALADSLIDQAQNYADQIANSSWFVSGTSRFDSIAEIAQNSLANDDLSGLRTQSSNQGINGQYLFDLNWLDILIGMNFKREAPVSDRHFYQDSIDLSFIEVGGLAILSAKFFKDRLALKAGLRVNKNELFNTQLSPNGSITYRIRNTLIWTGFQTGFRNPNYWDLFRNTSDGTIAHLGNSSGVEEVFESSEVQNVQQLYEGALNGSDWPDHCPDGDFNCLNGWLADSLNLNSFAALQPEKVSSVELGFRSVILKNLFVDVSGYYSWHQGKIYHKRLIDLETSNPTVAASLLHPDSSSTMTMSVPINSQNRLVTIGGSANVTYHFSDRIWANANYTYSKLVTTDHESLETAGFNIPDHRVNVGMRLRNIWKGLGFSVNFRFHDSYTWQSRIGTFDVPWTSILDAQISYQIPKLHSTFRIGGSNIINTPYRNVAGGSPLASTFYASILFDLSVQ